MKYLLFIPLLTLTFQVFAQNTDSAQYFYQKGLEEKTTERWKAASAYFDQAIALNPKFTAAYLEKGNVNLLMRNTDMALRSFVKVNELEPANLEVIKNLVTLFYNYHQYQKAIDFAAKCTGCQNMERTMALCYFRLEDYTSAERLLLKLVPHNPTDAELAYTLGKTYMEMELNAKAIPYYLKALQLDTAKATWLFELGMLYYATDNNKNAVVYFLKAKNNGFPVTNDFNENLGYAYIYSGEFDKGEKILQDILSKKRGNKEIMRDLAQIYYERKFYDKSLEFCQKLMELDVKDAKALYQAGLCFQKKGDRERGTKMCDRAIEMDPSLKGMKTKIETPEGL